MITKKNKETVIYDNPLNISVWFEDSNLNEEAPIRIYFSRNNTENTYSALMHNGSMTFSGLDIDKMKFLIKLMEIHKARLEKFEATYIK